VIGGDRKRDRAGRFDVEQRCDACSKPITERTGGHVTDDEVCGTSDAPGFYLCGRARCERQRASLEIDARRSLYAEGRARNDATS